MVNFCLEVNVQDFRSHLKSGPKTSIFRMVWLKMAVILLLSFKNRNVWFFNGFNIVVDFRSPLYLKIVENVISIIVLRFQELNLEQSPLSLSPTIIESPLVKSLTLPKTLTELWHKSSLPTTEKSTSYQKSTRLADTNLSSPKESGIPIQTFYGTSQTKNEQNKASTVPKLQSAQYSEDEPLSKYGRRHKKGRIICKKQAFYSLQPYNVTTPALKNVLRAMDTNRLLSTKSETDTLEKTDSNKTDDNNNWAKTACEITEPQYVWPKRRALSPKNSLFKIWPE